MVHRCIITLVLTPSCVPVFAAEKPMEVAAEATSRLIRPTLSHLDSIMSEFARDDSVQVKEDTWPGLRSIHNIMSSTTWFKAGRRPAAARRQGLPRRSASVMAHQRPASAQTNLPSRISEGCFRSSMSFRSLCSAVNAARPRSLNCLRYNMRRYATEVETCHDLKPTRFGQPLYASHPHLSQ